MLFVTVTILSIVVVVVLGLHLAMRKQWDLGSIIVLTSIVGTVAFCVFGVAAIYIESILPHETHMVQTSSEEIVAIKDGIQTSGEINGNFLLIRGSLTPDLVYTFFIVSPDGGYESRVLSDRGDGTVKVYQFEKGTKVPTYKVFHTTTTCSAPKWTYWISTCSDSPKYSEHPVNWEIHVPEGTIVMNTTIDLE